MSLSNQAVRIAYEAGYRIVRGKIISPKGKTLKGRIEDGYVKFGIRLPVSFTRGKRKCKSIKVHKMVAYQKYGEKSLESNVVIRHRDNDSLNNLDDNILMGSHSDNMMDKPESVRLSQSITASTHIRVLTDDQVAAVKTDRLVNGLSYSQLAEKYGLSGKGQAHYIVNHEYVTSKTTLYRDTSTT